MKKIINDPDFVVDDMLNGFVKVHHKRVRLAPKTKRVLVKSVADASKVSLVSGGGSGHEPAFLDYVRRGSLDAVAIGEVFTSPPAAAFLEAFLEADQGEGVLCMIGNYAGDMMNVNEAIALAQTQGVKVMLSIAKDDLASNPSIEKRYGIAAGPLIWAMAAQAKAEGNNLIFIKDLIDEAMRNTRTLTVGLKPGTIPALGKPNYQIEDRAMILGLGHHGEPGIDKDELKDAKEIAARLLIPMVDELKLSEKDVVVVVVSGLGATPMMEQYILFNEIHKALKALNIHIEKSFVDTYVSSLDMAGCALTLMKLNPRLLEIIQRIEVL